MRSTFWMTVQETEDELARRELKNVPIECELCGDEFKETEFMAHIEQHKREMGRA